MRKPTFETYTGLVVDPLFLRVDEINIVDIAQGLAGICRYHGHIRRHFSVAEHCLMVSTLLAVRNEPAEIQLAGLMHDASEAYLNDLAAPIKESPDMAAYRAAEENAMQRIWHRFDLTPYRGWEHPKVKEADFDSYKMESAALRPNAPKLELPLEDLTFLIDPVNALPMGLMAAAFRSRFERLMKLVAKEKKGNG